MRNGGSASTLGNVVSPFRHQIVSTLEKAPLTAMRSRDATAADMCQSEFANFSWRSERSAARSWNEILIPRRTQPIPFSRFRTLSPRQLIEGQSR